MTSRNHIAVIGAGMAGIGAARLLHDAGCHVVVFEKSRGFGGRCATKRWNGHLIDHGAQFFTIRSPEFRTALESACGPSLKRLETPILDGQDLPLPDEPRYYHSQGNSRLARDLAAGLTVRTETLLTPPVFLNSAWQIAEESFDHIVSTAPGPQTLTLAGLNPGPNNFHPCLTLVLRYDTPPQGKLREAYALSNPDDPVLAWTACENHKTGHVSGDHTVIVTQASPEFSRTHYEAEPAHWASLLRIRTEQAWGLENWVATDQFTHRWRYARTTGTTTPPVLPPGWHHAGDTYSRSRVETSWLSGREQAAHILTSF